MMPRKLSLIGNYERILAIMVAICICAISTASIAADESTQNSQQGKGKSSLIEISTAYTLGARLQLDF